MSDNQTVYTQWAKVAQTTIMYPQFASSLNLLEEAFKINQQVGLSMNCLVVGQAGTGKSTLKENLVKKYPPIQTSNKLITPVLAINIPPLPTIKNLAEEILLRLGDPYFYRGTAIEKTNRILILLKSCEVRLIMFDEMQHFVDRSHKKMPAEVADWLKTLIDKAQISTVLMGLERTQIILDSNEQLRRRFTRRVNLSPFDLENKSDRNTFLGVIRQLDLALALPERLDVHLPELIKQLHFATNGIIDYMVKLMLSAYRIAVEQQQSSINTAILEQAFTESIWSEGVGKMNPFNAKFIGKRLTERGMVFCKPT